MIRVPGLIPVQTDNSHATSNALQRGQSPDPSGIQAGSLSATATPVDTFVRTTENYSGSASLESLAAALSSFSPSLSAFLVAKAPTKEDMSGMARKVILSTDPSALDAAIKSGNTPAELQNLEGMRAYAEDKAYRDGAEFTRRYNTDFDKENGDVNALFREVTGPSLQDHGTDRAFTEVYTKAVQGSLDNVLGSFATYTADRIVTERKDVVFSGWYGRIEDMAAKGNTPDEIASSIYGDFSKNKDFLLMAPKQQQEMVLQLADQQATKGNYDVAKTLLKYERLDGPYRGSLLSDQTYGPKASDLLGRIENDQAKANLGAIATEAEGQVNAAVDAAIENGTVSAITPAVVPTAAGGTREISSDELIKAGSARLVDKVAAEAAQRGMTPEQARVLEKERFVGNGVKHPQWFDVMEAGATTLSTANLGGQALPPAAVEGFKVFRDLNKDSAQYLAKFASKDTRDLYDTANVFMEAGIYRNPEDALRAAAINRKSPDTPDATIADKKVQASVTQAMGAQTGFWSGPRTATNVNDVKAEIAKNALIFTRGGVGPDQAVEASQKMFLKSHVNVAGTYIKADKNMPTDFPTQVDSFLADYAKVHGVEVTDLTIREANKGAGAYYIADRATLMPAGDHPTLFSFGTITGQRDAARAAAAAKLIADQAATAVKRKADLAAAQAVDKQRVGDLNTMLSRLPPETPSP